MLREVVRRLVREPLVHFLLIGALLFAGISIVKDLRRPSVRIDAAEINQLAAYWELQMQRPPTKAELAGIIQGRVDEEILAREAIRLGLDNDDMIVRRRLAQKMAFAGEDLAAKEPTEAELRAYYAANAARWATPARLALTHVFFSRERTGDRPEMAAAGALAKAREGAGVAGDPSLLPLTYADVSLADLERDYGQAFAQAARAARLGEWTGPVVSPYGVHILRVDARFAPQTPGFDSVRGEVRDAWLADRRQAANAAFLARLRERYRVQIAGVGP